MSSGTFEKLRPLSLLTHLSGCYDTACLKVFSNSVSWSIYLEQGKIIYASHSIEPLDRVDCHLRRLSHRIPSLASEARSQLRLNFEIDSPQSQTQDYQAVLWLVNNQYLSCAQAGTLVEELVKEVVESFLLVETGSYELKEQLDIQEKFCDLELQPVIEHCQKRLQDWRMLGPQINSPYQRPYFLNQSKNQQQLSPEIKQRLSAMLKGFSFRHLAILLNQDELQLAKSLQPYIVAGTITLEEPHPPFDSLPKISTADINANPQQKLKVQNGKPQAAASPVAANKIANSSAKTLSTQLPAIPTASKPKELPASQAPDNGKLSNGKSAYSGKNLYKIVCVDDSQAMLNQISYFLDDESFSVVTISDPVKALMQIVRLKPDLILLDVNMAGINGYELCRLLRNHALFKNKPIIMVTGNTGVIDRVKARLVGASGYLTKPFDQSDLLKIIFRYLT